MLRTTARLALGLALGVTAAIQPMTVAQAAPRPGAPATQDRPNVVVIMVDDMRADELRYMPWTRRLIRNRGADFKNSFAPHPMCCPARASVLTGLTSNNHGVLSVDAPYGFQSFDDRSTVATWLRRSGYSNSYLGKYLNGYGMTPLRGQVTGSSLAYVPPGWNDWRGSLDGGFPAGHPKRGSTYDFFNTTLSRNGQGFVNYRGRYQTNVYGALTSQIVRARAPYRRPFFLYVSYTAPHGGGPLEPDDPLWVERGDGRRMFYPTPSRPSWVRGMFDSVITSTPGDHWNDPDYKDKPEYLQDPPPPNAAESAGTLELARQRAESLHVVDLQVKRTINALARTGELDRTYVVFTSDNGYLLGEQRMHGKLVPYEASLRVPMLIRGPGIPAGVQRFDPITSMDLAPTIAAFAKVAPGHVTDGRPMLRVARRGDQGWKRAVLTETGPLGGFVRDTDVAGNPVTEGDGRTPDVRYAIGVRTDRYLYVDHANGDEELYDMATDPWQYHNRVGAAGYAEVLDLLRAELRRVRACRGAQCAASMAPGLTTLPGQSIARRRAG